VKDYNKQLAVQIGALWSYWLLGTSEQQQQQQQQQEEQIAAIVSLPVVSLHRNRPAS